MSKWVGESERNIRQLFERARENRPSIIFIDEIDAIAARRGEVEVHDSQVNQLLAEIDGVAGQRGVFVVGRHEPAGSARPGAPPRRPPLAHDRARPARRGRAARDPAAPPARMPTVGVRLEELARETEGMSPADLKSLAQEAALAAMAGTAAARPL